MILSVAMMLRLSFKLEAEAAAIESAVRRTLATGLRTPDIASAGGDVVSTQRLGEAIAESVAAG
jgi:3-isopropylmalate dehydrogenase